MQIPYKLIIGVVAAISITILTWQLVDTTEPSTNIPTLEFADHSVDYYIKGFHVTSMGLDGLPDQSLSSDYLKHFQDDDTTELTMPHLVIYDKYTAPWVVDAKAGWISSDASLVLLSGKVYINRKKRGLSPEVSITGSNMRIQPKDHYFETDEKITIKSADSQIDSVGMNAWLKNPTRFKFLSNVRGHYATN